MNDYIPVKSTDRESYDANIAHNLNVKQVYEQICALSHEHAMVINSIMYGEGMYFCKPANKRIAKDTGISIKRVKEILAEIMTYREAI
jgi:hypothetical protein